MFCLLLSQKPVVRHLGFEFSCQTKKHNLKMEISRECKCLSICRNIGQPVRLHPHGPNLCQIDPFIPQPFPCRPLPRPFKHFFMPKTQFAGSKKQESDTQHFIFFVPHEWAQKVSVFSVASFPDYCNVTFQLIGPICNLPRKLKCFEYRP